MIRHTPSRVSKNSLRRNARLARRSTTQADIFEYIEMLYNRTRRHIHLGGVNVLGVEKWWKPNPEMKRYIETYLRQ